MRITIRTKIQKRNELNEKIPNFRSELSKMCFKEDIRAKIKQKWNFYFIYFREKRTFRFHPLESMVGSYQVENWTLSLTSHFNDITSREI